MTCGIKCAFLVIKYLTAFLLFRLGCVYKEYWCVSLKQGIFIGTEIAPKIEAIWGTGQLQGPLTLAISFSPLPASLHASAKFSSFLTGCLGLLDVSQLSYLWLAHGFCLTRPWPSLRAPLNFLLLSLWARSFRVSSSSSRKTENVISSHHLSALSFRSLLSSRLWDWLSFGLVLSLHQSDVSKEGWITCWMKVCDWVHFFQEDWSIINMSNASTF